MEQEKVQKELFEFEEPKRPRAKFGSLFEKTDFAITLTAEKMAFLAIGVIMLMVVFFALGVEKGKSLTGDGVSSAKVSIAKTPAPQAQVQAPAIQPKAAPYTIVAAAFKRNDLAVKEVSQLKSKGLEAFVYYSEPYYLTCVGSFANKDGAQKALSKVRQMHRDAYVRLK